MGIEIEILNFIQTIHNPVLDRIMMAITKLGDAGIVWIILTVILLLVPKTRKTGWYLLFALVVDMVLCNWIMKPLVARVRPYDVNTAVQLLISPLKDYSFPSGHTAASFASVTALYMAGQKKLWKIALVLAILIAVSRLYLYVHYPTDVLGGIVIGILSGMIGSYFVQNKIIS